MVVPRIASWGPPSGGPFTIHDSRFTISLYSREVLARFRVDANQIARVDEWRHVDHDAGLESRGLDLIARRRALDAGSGVRDLQVHCRRQLDAHRLGPVELDVDRHLRLQVPDGVAERFTGDVNLLVIGRVHEIEVVAV